VLLDQVLQHFGRGQHQVLVENGAGTAVDLLGAVVAQGLDGVVGRRAEQDGRGVAELGGLGEDLEADAGQLAFADFGVDPNIRH